MAISCADARNVPNPRAGAGADRPPGVHGAVSERKRAANRANARHSTGPRTAPGKAKVARNALRHGLARTITPDPAHAAEVEALARSICGLRPGPGTDAEAADPALQRQLHLARRIAAAQVDLGRVQRACRDLMARAGEMPVGGEKLPDDKQDDVQLQEPMKRAAVLLELVHELVALNRYLGHAWSRREFAMRKYIEGLKTGFDSDLGADNDAIANGAPPSPSPLWGRVGVGGRAVWQRRCHICRPPPKKGTPCPPHKGEGSSRRRSVALTLWGLPRRLYKTKPPHRSRRLRETKPPCRRLK
jgi:hypothetical protein